MSRTTKLGRATKVGKAGFWLAVLVLLALHFVQLDQGDAPLRLGWVPRDMAFRLAWIGAAAGVVFYMTNRLWPDEGGDP